MKTQTLIDQSIDWVEKIHKESEHLIKTAYWVKQIDPQASDEMVIACITHDIERAFTKGRNPPGVSGERWTDKDYLLWHGKRSAYFAGHFLEEKGASKTIINKVKELIEVHEIGGNYEENLIKDADSISFLEVNARLFISWVPKRYTKDQVKKKFDFMYGRITLAKAKMLAEPLYKKAIRELNKLR